MTSFEKGFVLGLIVGEGHLGGDRLQPQITIRMHVRHLPLLRWVNSLLPGGALYGPYEYAGRRSYQLMFRHAYLRQIVVPMLSRLPWSRIDPHSYARFQAMLRRYCIDAPASGAEEDDSLLSPPHAKSLREVLDRSKVPRGTFSPLLL